MTGSDFDDKKPERNIGVNDFFHKINDYLVHQKLYGGVWGRWMFEGVYLEGQSQITS